MTVGFANITSEPSEVKRIEILNALDVANKKIAALEKKVAELTIKNIYLQTA